MSSAWIGLIGVVVGGVISTLWQWLAVVRQELSDAVVSARLVYEDLQERPSQGAANAEPDPSVWIENRAPLARTLGHEQWDAVADAYRVPADRSADAAAASPKKRLEAVRKKRLKAGRDAIEPYAKNKRSVIGIRLRNSLPKWARRDRSDA